MAKPYQDLQGNWFVAGRPMSGQELELYSAVQAQKAPAMAQPQAPVPVAPKPQAVDPVQAAIIEAQRQKQLGLNPIGAGMDFLFGGK